MEKRIDVCKNCNQVIFRPFQINWYHAEGTNAMCAVQQAQNYRPVAEPKGAKVDV